jgi:hypothetical protein
VSRTETELVSEAEVESFARARWEARRQAIIDSGTAGSPGAAWDEIEPSPRNGHDIRASEWNAARSDLALAASVLRGEDGFSLTEADVKLLTSDLSDYDGDPERAMEAMLALDQRFRDWLAR